MVKVFKLSCSLLFFVYFLFSCTNKNEEDVILIDKYDLVQYFNESGDTHSILINTESDLTAISSDSSWCNAEIWTNNHKKKVFITVKSNKNREKRLTKISLEAKGRKVAEIEVAQLGLDKDFLVNQDSILISDKLDFNVNIISNIPLEFSLPDWIKENDASIPSEGKFIFRADKLPINGLPRKGQLIIKGKNENKDIETIVTISQEENMPCFAIISDILIGRLDAKERLVKRLTCLLDGGAPIDALFIVGDLTDRGAPSQYEELKSICDSIIPKDVLVYFMMGNSDHYIDKGDVFFQDKIKQPIHQYFTIKGYPFITLSMTGIYTDKFTQEDKDFLLKHLQEARVNYPDKPIFFFTHIGMSDTFYGTEKNISNLGSQILAPILKQFPEIIAFSGHVNFPLGDPRSIHQEVFTSINVGSGNQNRIEYGYTEGIYPPNIQNVAEGLIVLVQENGDVEVERWDTYRKEEIFPRWLIKAPHNGNAFSYTNRTGGETPRFDEYDNAKIGVLSDGTYTVSFPRAKDDEIVHHYIIEVLDNGEVVFENTRVSQFYLNSAAPKEFIVKLFGLPADVSLIAQVKAVDSFGNTSLPLTSKSFIAKPFVPDSNTKIPVADLFDIQFGENGKAIDISPNNIYVGVGETIPETYFNEKFGRYSAIFKNNRTSFYKVDYTQNTKIKEAIANAFVLETFYMSNNLDNAAPLSGKEWEGLGIEQENGGQIEFWAYMDEKYIKAKSSVYIKTGEYYHVVVMYNKNSEKMSIYINGKKKGEIEARGNLLIPKRPDSRWFCIGGDTHPQEKVQLPLNGEVVLARMYEGSLSDDQIYLLYQNIINHK